MCMHNIGKKVHIAEICKYYDFIYMLRKTREYLNYCTVLIFYIKTNKHTYVYFIYKPATDIAFPSSL
jgi:hypothetical protein